MAEKRYTQEGRGGTWSDSVQAVQFYLEIDPSGKSPRGGERHQRIFSRGVNFQIKLNGSVLLVGSYPPRSYILLASER